jgi:MarR family transcriptional regulator, organic hydroperoxide resistance regulator
MDKLPPGLGELLRHLGDLVDRGSEMRYAEIGLDYRPRYTPVLRALEAGATTVNDITQASHLTQGAVSQTLGLMAQASLITRHALPDGRKSEVRLTDAGQTLMARASGQWGVIFSTLDELEAEIGHRLRTALADAIAALERRGFAQRLRENSDDA